MYIKSLLVDSPFEILVSHSRMILRKDKFGAVAQLGERVNGIHEVEGSIPFSSTNK